ncbi:MAG: hypothetical protein V5A44_13665 [Haloarculaceae archaeon]
MERRTFLSVGGASVLALAAGSPSIAAGPDSDGPAAVVSEYYRRARAAEDSEAFAEEVPDLTHSVSPLSALATDAPLAFDGTLRQDVVDIEVVEEDVGAERIEDVSDFFAASVGEEGIARLAGNNAVVAVTLESEEVIGGRVAKEWLVAPEDGEWRLVWFDDRNSPRAVVRQFFREVNVAGSFEALDEPVDDLSHSVSPLLNVVEYNPRFFAGLRRQELTGTEVVAENLDTDELADRFGLFANWARRADTEPIAGENAVVAVSLRDEHLGTGEFVQDWLVAPDSGEWRVVWFQ